MIEHSDKIQKRLLGLYALKDRIMVVAEQESRLRHFRKSKMSIIKNEIGSLNPKWSNAKCEDYARAHPDYIQVCEGFAAATAEAESIRWELKVAMQSMELLRTAEATKRQELKSLTGQT